MKQKQKQKKVWDRVKLWLVLFLHAETSQVKASFKSEIVSIEQILLIRLKILQKEPKAISTFIYGTICTYPRKEGMLSEVREK